MIKTLKDLVRLSHARKDVSKHINNDLPDINKSTGNNISLEIGTVVKKGILDNDGFNDFLEYMNAVIADTKDGSAIMMDDDIVVSVPYIERNRNNSTSTFYLFNRMSVVKC